MRQNEKKKRKDRTAATIMLCFCLLALTSVFTIKASIDKVARSAGNLPVTQDTSLPTETETEADADANAETKIKDESVAPPAETPEEAPVSTEIPTVDSEPAPETPGFLCPMDMANAQVVKPFSMDMVVYNMTLDQYMTHPGVDIEAPMNSGVKAVADGQVTAVYEDDAYGITIEITHENGFRSRYANLGTRQMVEQGDSVKRGQQLSVIGQSALCESIDKCHLHFELYQGEQLLDPATYIDFS